MNALEWNRDLSRPIRERESRPDMDRGCCVSLPGDACRGNIGLCGDADAADSSASQPGLPGWHSPAQAQVRDTGQLAWYREMEQQAELAQITNLEQLEAHLAKWELAQPSRSQSAMCSVSRGPTRWSPLAIWNRPTPLACARWVYMAMLKHLRAGHRRADRLAKRDRDLLREMSSASSPTSPT